MTILVFGHKSPDSDSVGSAILWAWYLREIKAQPAEAALLGPPNTEAAFMLAHWDVPQPASITDVADGAPVVIVDTNNPAELPSNINNADIRAIIDHHKLVGGLQTRLPIDITMRPLACTATLMIELMGKEAAAMPDWAKGVALTCILSDTLEFRSPTTTAQDRATAEALAADLGLEIPAYAAQMFAAKSDVSHLSDAALLRMDSKEYTLGGKVLRISVSETTAPEAILARKAGMMAAMEQVAAEDGADHVLMFVVDILNENAILLIPNEWVRDVAYKSFGVLAKGDTVILPGIMSRKKQIIPNLTL